MNPQLATVVFSLGIAGLFVLDWDRKARTSNALWIPIAWLSIAGSRMVSQWLAATGPDAESSLSSPDQYLDGSPLDRNVLTALLVVAVIVLVKRGPRVRRLLVGNGPILLFYSYCALSILWSDYPEVAFKRWIKFFGNLVMVLIVLTDPDRSYSMRRFLARTGFLLMPLSILFIKYYPDLGRGYHPWIWKPYYTGVTTNKNTLGMICLVFGLGSVWHLLQALRGRGERTRRAGPLIAHTALLAMVMWLFWKANSMTSLCCFLLASGLMVVTSLRWLALRPVVVHVLVGAILFLSFSALFLDFGMGLVETLGRDPTLTGRTAIWDLVIGMNDNPLVGSGFESFWLGPRVERIWNMYWWHPNEAHNGYIEIFLNLGSLGLALLAGVMVKGYQNIMVALRRNVDTGTLRLAYFVTALAYNFTESAFRMIDPVWIVFVVAVTAVPDVPFPQGVNISAHMAPAQCHTDLRLAKTHSHEEVV